MSYIGRSPQIGAYHKLDAITTDGSASYTMQLDSANFVPESVNHLIVSVNGVIQAPTDSFTVSGSTITFASSLSVSDTIDFIMALGNVLDIGTPSDATVSLSKLTATGTPSASTFLRGDNSWSSAGGIFETQLLHVRDEKSNGTPAGGNTGGTWNTRVLNTVLTNEITSASLSSNQITLPSGTYFITASAPMHVVARHKLKLRNITDSSDTLIGTSEYHNSDEQVRSFLTGRFTIASSKTFELQHYSQNSTATNGLGMQTSASVVEVYADVQIWKVA